MAGRIFQIMECLDYGDGVSNMARAFAPLLAANGAERQIVTLHTHETLRAETIPFESIVWRPEDAVIVHVWNTTRLEAFLRAFPGRKAIFFHNITPPEFFEPGSECYRETEAAWRQLPRLAELADIWLAPSAFNLSALAAVARTPRPSYVVPAPVDPRQERARPVDPGRLATLKSHDEVNILFVGRLAPNKAQERLMEVFDHYHLRINRRSRLHLVGGSAGNGGYARALAERRAQLPSGDTIEMPGKVSDAELQAYYAAADLFLCLSEHEGFCLPPLVAAAHGVPVLARAAAAVPETIGPAAVLLHDYDPARIAELAHLVLTEAPLRERLLAAAERHLPRFGAEAVKEAWRAPLAALRGSKDLAAACV